MKSKQEMEKMLGILLDEGLDYQVRLEAYEYLQEDCEEMVDTMLQKFYESQGETADMLIEILSEYPGNKGVYMGLVSCLYRGEDVALYARLLGKYGDDSAIEVLKSVADSGELNYNEYMEVRNAIEELGGYLEDKEGDFKDDEFYRYLKGLDEPDDDSRRSPFESILNPEREDDDFDDEDECDDDCHCDDDCDCHHHDHDCHHHDCEE